MKDKIFEEYGIKINCFIYKNNLIFFNYSDEKYMIEKTDLNEYELNELSKIIAHADYYSVFFHKIIPNKHGYIFEFGGKKYVILKIRIKNNRLISIDDILKVSNIEVNVNYFIGLSENSIELFGVANSQSKRFINHKRVSIKETTIDFYNPLNIVIDFKTRDLAEYAKSLFINGENRLFHFLNYLNFDDYVTYFARLLYPSFYFDHIDSYINGEIKVDEKKIRQIANSYEQNLKKLYMHINARVKISNIEWLSDINNL